MKKLLFICLVWLQMISVLAQNFPVQIVTQLAPPYPTNLSGYANPNAFTSPIRVQINLGDITSSSREIQLRVAIESTSVNAVSAPVVTGVRTLILDGGIPLRLDIADLAPYFQLQNLQGISPAQYNATLPDGNYQFCFEVFDTFTGNRLSSKSCSSAFLINNDPPFLNIPLNQTNVSEQTPLNIRFQWTPRHVNVSNVSYTFSLVEIWDNYVDPQAVFLASPPLYEEETTATSLVYGPLQPPLISGKRYAWRVRAKATNNGEEIPVFNNNGSSEIFWFEYKDVCEAPTTIQIEEVTTTNATLSWLGHPDHLDYTIVYREKGSRRWYSKTTPREYYTFDEFRPDTVYEYKIRGNCTPKSYGESDIASFKTQSREESDYANCGIGADAADISNKELLTELTENTVFTAGDFPVYVKKASGSTSFSGEGYISTPWLATVRIPVTFQNIKINTDMKMIEGTVVTTYDPNWGSIVDTDEIIEDIVGDTGKKIEIAVDFEIVDITVTDGKVIITGADGQKVEEDGGQDVTYTDTKNQRWNVSKDGTVTKGNGAEGGEATAATTAGAGGSGVNQISATDLRVDFIPSGYYSADQLPNNATPSMKRKYDGIPMADGGTYYPIYKAIGAMPGHPNDFLRAEVTFNDTSRTTDDIVFKTKNGSSIPVSWDENIATLTLEKQFDFVKEQILATVKPTDSTQKYTIAGTANLWHLSTQSQSGISVTIVPINNAPVDINTLREEINAIYAPVGIQFTLREGEPLEIPQAEWDLDRDTKLNIGDSKLLEHYTAEERAIRDYYKSQISNYNPKTYYIFITDLPTSDTSTAGFMPLKRQYGFVFDTQNTGRTLAHELGHGVFGLEHPFSEYDMPSGSTEFLLDYGSGTAFSHMDWEKLHSPGIQLYWFQGDEDGESSTGIQELAFSDAEQFNPGIENLLPEYKTCVSPAGVVVQLPAAATPKYLGHHNSLNIAEGVLSEFVLNGKLYKGWYHPTTKMFTGYKESVNDPPFEFDPITESTVLVTLGYKVTTISCGKILVTGEYTPTHRNTTGVGDLIRNQDIQLGASLERHPDLLPIQIGCLPSIQLKDFRDYEFGKLNFFGKRGFLRVVRNTQGSLSYVYSNIDNEGDLYQLQYLPDNGRWYYRSTPPTRCTSCDLNRLFMALYNPRDIGHFILDSAGMVPWIGELFDAANGVWYIIEGDGVNAAISFASTIPFVYATTSKHIGKIIRLADRSYSIAKFGGNSVEFLSQLNRLNLDSKTLKLLNADLANKEFAEAMTKNPELLVIWKRFSSFTTSKKEWIRKNVSLLEKMSKQSNEVQDKIVDYYKTFQKPSASGSPPFQFTTKSNHIVQFDEFAQPRFEPFIPRMKGNGKVVYNPEKVSDLPDKNFSELMGSKGHDIADANRWIKQEFPDKVDVLSNGQVKILNENDEWITCVWHHHEDGRNIIPVPIEIHNRPLGGASHTGGNSIIDKGLKDFFDSLKLEN